VRTGQCLDYAQQQGMLVLLKAHGGMCALAEDLLYALKRLPHPNFGICYDPGNIYYYTGQKAEEDLPKVAAQVKAMCIKDETGGKEGEVMITPHYSVDFPPSSPSSMTPAFRPGGGVRGEDLDGPRKRRYTASSATWWRRSDARESSRSRHEAAAEAWGAGRSHPEAAPRRTEDTGDSYRAGPW
jgi:hypothetical protein